VTVKQEEKVEKIEKIAKVEKVAYTSLMEKSLTIKNIDAAVLNEFKAWAAFQGMTIREALIIYMKEKGKEVKVETGESP
jgi:hypothetical protein